MDGTTFEKRSIVRLPPDLSLLETEASGVINQLVATAERVHEEDTDIPGVLLLQTAPAGDDTPGWLAELDEDRLLEDLAGAIDTFRWLLSLIRNSPVPWVYAAHDHCFGSYWELALSCQRRLFFSSTASLGFPSIRSGAFPPGGVLESLRKRAGKTKERWQTNPVFNAGEALEEGLIHFTSDATDWEPVAKRMFDELLEQNPQAGVRKGQRKQRRQAVEVGVNRERMAALAELESVWKGERLRTGGAPLAWDYCWQLVKGRSKLRDSRDLGRLIGYIAARHYLGRHYRSWLALEVIRKKQSVEGRPDVVYLPPVSVDLEALIPPTKILLRLLRRGIQLVLAAQEPEELKAAAELIYGRLEREAGSQTAQRYWDKQVTWFVGQAASGGSLVLSFTVDDYFHVTDRENTWSYLRLAGNEPTAGAGVLELMEDRTEASLGSAASAHAMAQVLCDGVVHTQRVGGERIPVSVCVRSLFFDELMRICNDDGEEVVSLISRLGDQSWGYAGNEQAWDKFLRTRCDAYAYDPALEALGFGFPTKSHWEVAALKSLPNAPEGGSPSTSPWNPTRISQHMAVLTGLIAVSLLHQGLTKSPEDADLLCLRALGFPVHFGTPLTYLRSRGRRRVEYETRKTWRTFPVEALWSAV